MFLKHCKNCEKVEDWLQGKKALAFLT